MYVYIFANESRLWAQRSSDTDGRIFVTKSCLGSMLIQSTASNLEQVADLLRAQANSASLPQRDTK